MNSESIVEFYTFFRIYRKMIGVLSPGVPIVCSRMIKALLGVEK